MTLPVPLFDIDIIRIIFSDDNKLILKMCLAFVMFRVATHISTVDFLRVAGANSWSGHVGFATVLGGC